MAFGGLSIGEAGALDDMPGTARAQHGADVRRPIAADPDWQPRRLRWERLMGRGWEGHRRDSSMRFSPNAATGCSASRFDEAP